MNEERCGTCRFYNTHTIEGDSPPQSGMCHAHPPVLNPVYLSLSAALVKPSAKDKYKQLHESEDVALDWQCWVRPPVQPSDWCGEWSPCPTTQGKEDDSGAAAREEVVATTDYKKLNYYLTRIPGHRRGKPCHLTTLVRWVTKGIKTPTGEVVRLRAVRLGAKWVCTDQWFEAFMSAITAASVPVDCGD